MLFRSILLALTQLDLVLSPQLELLLERCLGLLPAPLMPSLDRVLADQSDENFSYSCRSFSRFFFWRSWFFSRSRSWTSHF